MGSTRDDARPKVLSPYLEEVVSEIEQEFHDSAPPASNRRQAYNLWSDSGLDEQQFVDVLYVARARTKGRGNIDKPASGGMPGTRNRMPYFWKVLRTVIEESAPKRNQALGVDTRASIAQNAAFHPTAARSVHAYQTTITVAADGLPRVDQPLAVPPGRYRAIIVIGGKEDDGQK